MSHQRLLLLLLILALSSPEGRCAEIDGEDAVDFKGQIVPLLQARCFRCHEGRDPESGHRLDLKAELLGQTGGTPLVVAGNSGQSRLIELVSGKDPKRVMPPEGERLSQKEVSLLTRWIDAGLPWDGAVLPECDESDQHWAFQPVKRPPVPAATGELWNQNPVDAFVVQMQREHSLAPAPPARRAVLARRLYLDLCGLPPSWEDVERLAADECPDAVERLVDRLLASPAYGEHWGRHWLDIARWAESEGFESNHPRPFAWRYRDYVTAAFCADKPYDVFLRQQIAGDELPEYTDENLIATGFLAAARISSNEEDKWLQKNDVTVDITNALGSAFLGLTLHCAQCHNHKFDPVSTKDYYRLHAFFARGLPLNVELRDKGLLEQYRLQLPPEYEPALALKDALFEKARRWLWETQLAALTSEERKAVQTPVDKRTTAEELLARKASLRLEKSTSEIEKQIEEPSRKLYDELKKRLAEIEKSVSPRPQTFAFYSPATSPHPSVVLPSLGFYPLPYEPQELARLKTSILVRGEVHRIGPEVTPGVPTVLTGRARATNSPPATLQTRLQLAGWLADRKHPLVSRVWVNRLWQHHFGRGIVATSDDFGLRGAAPSHPELLDWLAAELMEHGWSTKRIHRLIVNSATYRQSAEGTLPAQRSDPDNRFLSRWSPRRLEAEVLHDALLAAGSELDRRVGGPSVSLEQREKSLRRNLYLFQKRGQPAEMQRLFDGPSECAQSIAWRYTSTSPLQSLYLLNSEFATERSEALAAEIAKQTPDEIPARVSAAFRHILLRQPTDEELREAERFWLAAQTPSMAQQASPLALLCQAIFNLNEFAYLE